MAPSVEHGRACGQTRKTLARRSGSRVPTLVFGVSCLDSRLSFLCSWRLHVRTSARLLRLRLRLQPVFTPHESRSSLVTKPSEILILNLSRRPRPGPAPPTPTSTLASRFSRGSQAAGTAPGSPLPLSHRRVTGPLVVSAGRCREPRATSRFPSLVSPRGRSGVGVDALMH